MMESKELDKKIMYGQITGIKFLDDVGIDNVSTFELTVEVIDKPKRIGKIKLGTACNITLRGDRSS